MEVTPQSLYNAQPHITEVKTGINRTPKMKSDLFTFLLPHKHYTLEQEEIIWFEKQGPHYKTEVITFDSVRNRAFPCMWLWGNGDWVACGFTKKEYGLGTAPECPYVEGCNIGMKWLNNGGTEHTSTSLREQETLPRGEGDGGIETMYSEGDDGLECIIGLCVIDNNNHCAGI